MGKRKPKLCRTNLQRVSQNSHFSFNRERTYLCPPLLMPFLFLLKTRLMKSQSNIITPGVSSFVS